MEGSPPGPIAAMPSWIAQRHGPPAWSEAEQAFILTRYADVAQLLRSPSASAVEVHPGIERIALRAGRDYGSLVSLLAGMAFFRNAPVHTSVRHFLRRGIGVLADRFGEEAVGRIVDELLEPLVDKGPFDAMPALGTRLPVLVMGRALDLSEETIVVLRRDGQGVVDGWRRGLPLRVYDALQRQAAAVESVLLQEIAAARRQGEGGLARLVRLNDDAFQLDERMLAACIFTLILTGIETTAGFLGSTLLFLSTEGRAERLRKDPAGMRSFLDEVLRYAPPLRRATARRLEEPTEFGGTELPAGVLAIPEIEDAHHDPSAFGQPERFAPGRGGPPSLAFAAGAHACLGGVIAQMEGRLLASRIAAVAVPSLAAQPEWQDHPSFRRLRTLPLELRSRSFGNVDE
ncbi:cytochrome P450 [Roseomonas sp. SSH11]|uniref:Cytochrome P450 n=1 Tax=Pararoseomonas baculiformis TaxID=2820812 RepID=A0ABS4AET9_9PROT|nr:cytochrome P450 [Pararoseomonas baculiformis]MBP0445060.1 cytochrome P450 [Pararoseomonas baculiformis]